MIFTDSRYADGTLIKTFDSRTATYEVSVVREFPEDSADFYYYVWRSKDRLDQLAYEKLGSSAFWWRIMDYNPEIINAANIAPGTVIRIPNG